MLRMYAEQYANGVDKMVDVMVKEAFGGVDAIKAMEPGELKLIKVALKTIDAQSKLIVKQAQALDEMNAKLDKLLSRGEEA